MMENKMTIPWKKMLIVTWVQYTITQPFYYKQNATQSQFLNRVQIIWIQGFPSPKLVALSRLKNEVCSIHQ